MAKRASQAADALRRAVLVRARPAGLVDPAGQRLVHQRAAPRRVCLAFRGGGGPSGARGARGAAGRRGVEAPGADGAHLAADGGRVPSCGAWAACRGAEALGVVAHEALLARGV